MAKNKATIITRYAIIGRGGSVQNLLFETQEGKHYMIAFKETKSSENPIESEYMRSKVFEAIDKDLSVDLKFADRVFNSSLLKP
jgi:hypothetical protein